MSKKLAEQLAEEYLNSDEGQFEILKINEALKDFIIYGRSETYFDEKLLKDTCGVITIEELSVDEIIQRFSAYLSEDDINNLKLFYKQ